MKSLFVSFIGLILVIGAAAQQQAPPPLNPSIVPARPQPGVAAGASGRSAFPEAPRGIGRRPGGPNTPFPVVVPPNTHPAYPEVFDPLELVDLFEIIESTPPQPAPAQGRPGGLGVTITGGSTNPPGVAPPAAPNSPNSVVTNAPPTAVPIPPYQ